MLTTLSIMSLDQGKLRPMNEAEDDYFARLTKSEKLQEKLLNLLALVNLLLLHSLCQKAKLMMLNFIFSIILIQYYDFINFLF